MERVLLREPKETRLTGEASTSMAKSFFRRLKSVIEVSVMSPKS